MDADKLLDEINALTHPPQDELAVKVNELFAWVVKGGRLPAAWALGQANGPYVEDDG